VSFSKWCTEKTQMMHGILLRVLSPPLMVSEFDLLRVLGQYPSHLDDNLSSVMIDLTILSEHAWDSKPMLEILEGKDSRLVVTVEMSDNVEFLTDVAKVNSLRHISYLSLRQHTDAKMDRPLDLSRYTKLVYLDLDIYTAFHGVTLPSYSESLTGLNLAFHRGTTAPFSLKGCRFPNLKTLHVDHVDDSVPIDFSCFPLLDEFRTSQTSCQLTLDLSKQRYSIDRLLLGGFSGIIKLPVTSPSYFSVSNLSINEVSLTSSSLRALLPLVRTLTFSCPYQESIDSLAAALSGAPSESSDRCPLASETLEKLDISCLYQMVKVTFGLWARLSHLNLLEVDATLLGDHFPSLIGMYLQKCATAMKGRFSLLTAMNLSEGILSDDTLLDAPNLHTLVIRHVKYARKLTLLNACIPSIGYFSLERPNVLPGVVSILEEKEYYPAIPRDGLVSCGCTVEIPRPFPGSEFVMRKCPGDSCPKHPLSSATLPKAN